MILRGFCGFTQPTAALDAGVVFSLITSFEYNKLSMNRKNETQHSTERLLKSKYLEKEKSRITTNTNLGPRKIMLTDLCPEEKLKVGELIKINQMRKQEILEMTEQMNEIRLKFADCHSRLIELEQEFELKEQECGKLNVQVEQLQEKTIELEIVNSKLSIQNKQLKEVADRLRNKENASCQTESPSKTATSMQTKKVKTRTKEVQVESDQLLIGHKLLHENRHSKSFDRILKEKSSLKNSFSQSQNEILYSQNASSHNEDEEEQELPYDPKAGHEEFVQERLNDLAKQWLELKEKKVSHLKAQYENSKAHLLKEDLITAPKEFTYQDNVHSSQNQLEADEIDDNQLNNLLKSKNFSASRLLTSKGMMGESQNSRKGSVNEKTHNERQPPVNYSIKGPKLTLTSNNKKSARSPAFEKYEGVQSNFYESDFMDLVDSLNE